jgi:hypothetical protein
MNWAFVLEKPYFSNRIHFISSHSKAHPCICPLWTLPALLPAILSFHSYADEVSEILTLGVDDPGNWQSIGGE